MKSYAGYIMATPERQIALQAMADHRCDTVGELIATLVETLADQLLEEAGWKPGMSGPTLYDYVRTLCERTEREELTKNG